MTDKFENIKADDAKLNKDGFLDVCDELKNAIAGGINPEDLEDEAVNKCSITINGSCEQQEV